MSMAMTLKLMFAPGPQQPISGRLNKTTVPARPKLQHRTSPAQLLPIIDTVTPADPRPRCPPSPTAPVRSHAHGQLTNCPSPGLAAPPCRPDRPRPPRSTARSKAARIRPRSPRSLPTGIREARPAQRCSSTSWSARWVRSLRLARRRRYRVGPSPPQTARPGWESTGNSSHGSFEATEEQLAILGMIWEHGVMKGDMG